MKTIQIDDELFGCAEYFAQVLDISVHQVIDQVLRQGLMSPFESQTVQLLNLAGEQEYETCASATLVAQRLEGEIAELHMLHATNPGVALDVGLIDAQPVSLERPGHVGFRLDVTGGGTARRQVGGQDTSCHVAILGWRNAVTMPTYRTAEAAPPVDTGVSPDSTLPGLRGLRNLADLRPVIVVDSREVQPLKFERLASVIGTLYSGDYSIFKLEDCFSVERKSISDLVGCVTTERERFEHELLRLRGHRFRRLLIIGSYEDIAAGRYHSRVNPRSVLATLSTFEIRYDLPVVFASTPQEGAMLVERWCWYYAREVVQNANNLLRGTWPTGHVP